jgi:hypothetical protein
MTAIARIAVIPRIAAIADKQTGRQTYRHIGGQTGRQTDRKADRYISTKIYHPRIKADADINKQTGFPPNQCTYCTQLAGFYTDDTSPWVLSSIHIQRRDVTNSLVCRLLVRDVLGQRVEVEELRDANKPPSCQSCTKIAQQTGGSPYILV